MRFNKDSKIVKISAYAQAYHSEATAYGELYVPYEFYKENEELLEDLSVYVSELDGKFSETECDVEFETLTILDIISTENTSYDDFNRKIDYDIIYGIGKLLGFEHKEKIIIEKFSNRILNLEKINIIKDCSIILSKDTKIEDVIIPKDTLLEYSLTINKPIDENFGFEFDWDFNHMK